MSVINKMLRDLDSRQGAGTIPVQARPSRTGLARGTVIVNDSDRTGRRPMSQRFAVPMAASVMLVGGVLAGWWILNQSTILPRQVTQASVAAPAGVVARPVAEIVPVPEPTPAQAVVALKMDSTIQMPPSPTTPSRPVVADTAPAVPERSLAERPLKERTVAPAAPAPAPVVDVPRGPARRPPALEALAQAQSLWSAGSHEAGIDLLRDALAVAERENRSGTPSANNSVLASLARELARMTLAQGEVGPALEMLTRLEPALAGFADVWAIRGNAAQRLGRHEESAAAYLMALKLRPDEARWMLGAAVSLAAQGQTASAAELAEKARRGGVLSREVATYLRQLGVNLREH